MHLMTMRPKSGALILAAAAGIFFGSPNPVVHLPHTALLTPFALFLSARFSRSWEEALTHGWLAGLLGHASSLYWLTLPITEVGGVSLIPAAACVLLLSAYLSLFTGLTCLAGRTALSFYDKAGATSRIDRPDQADPADASSMPVYLAAYAIRTQA